MSKIILVVSAVLVVILISMAIVASLGILAGYVLYWILPDVSLDVMILTGVALIYVTALTLARVIVLIDSYIQNKRNRDDDDSDETPEHDVDVFLKATRAKRRTYRPKTR